MNSFILGLLATNSVLLLWFYSPLKITLARLLFKEVILDNESFDDLINIKLGEKFATLSGCYICMSFWTSLVIGITIAFIIDCWLMPIISFFCYPAVCYFVKKYIFDKKN